MDLNWIGLNWTGIHSLITYLIASLEAWSECTVVLGVNGGKGLNGANGGNSVNGEKRVNGMHGLMRVNGVHRVMMSHEK